MNETEVILRKITHRMRTPLAAISMATTSLKDILNSENKFITPQNLSISNTLMNNILISMGWCNWYLTLLDLGVREINQENFPLSKCAMELILSEAVDKYLKVHYEKVKISNKTTNFDFQGNERLVTQIFFYLLDNAAFSVKYARKGEILISHWDKDDCNYIEFKDTGMGIPEKYLDKIYDASFSTRNSFGNGLFFSKKAMIYMGGEIMCNSQEGKFTSFTLKFPKLP